MKTKTNNEFKTNSNILVYPKPVQSNSLTVAVNITPPILSCESGDN